MKGNNPGDYIKAGVSFLLIILFLSLESFVPNEQITELTKLIIEVAKLSFTFAVAWYTQKILSRQEYLKNLKERAVSAYRRIKDLNSSISVLFAEIGSTMLENNALRKDLNTLRVATNLIQITTASSIADWDDILREEIETIEAVAKLRKQEEDLLLTAQADDTGLKRNEILRVIQDEINKLESKLPVSLRGEFEEESLSSGGKVRLQSCPVFSRPTS